MVHPCLIHVHTTDRPTAASYIQVLWCRRQEVCDMGPASAPQCGFRTRAQPARPSLRTLGSRVLREAFSPTNPAPQCLSLGLLLARTAGFATAGLATSGFAAARLATARLVAAGFAGVLGVEWRQRLERRIRRPWRSPDARWGCRNAVVA